MMGIREEIENLRKAIPKNLNAPMPNGTKAPSLSYYLVYNSAVKDVLSILDEWELVVEMIAKKDVRLVSDVVGRALLLKYDEMVSSGDHVTVYVRKR